MVHESAVQMIWDVLVRSMVRPDRGVRALRIASVAAVALSFGACAVTSESPLETRRDVVRARATERWQAVIKGDLDKAYGFMSETSWQATSLDRFKARSRVAAFTGAEIQKVECEAEICRVDVFVTYDHRLMKGVGMPLRETWVIERGNAWYIDPIK